MVYGDAELKAKEDRGMKVRERRGVLIGFGLIERCTSEEECEAV
jgi:hypothetical protein